MNGHEDLFCTYAEDNTSCQLHAARCCDTMRHCFCHFHGVTDAFLSCGSQLISDRALQSLLWPAPPEGCNAIGYKGAA